VPPGDNPTPAHLDRREFAEALALLAVAPLIGLHPTPLAPTNPGASLPAFAGAEPGAIAKALAGVIRARYGERLNEADLATITRQIEAVLERAEKIRKVPLGNGDEPDFVFTAVRSEPAV
jgi:hypothetical protein